jgi:hypothetical protein
MLHHVRLSLVVPTVAFLVAAGGCSSPVPAPTSFETYNAKDGSFQCEYPADWEADGGGKGYYWAKFTKGTAEIAVDVQVSGSLMGDIAASGMSMALPGVKLSPEEMEAEAPVAKVHQIEKDQVAEQMGNYAEQPPQAVRPKLGDTRKSEFTAAAFGGAIHGYRVTCLSRDKRIRVVCKCSESDWQTLQPAFDRIVESLAYGKAEIGR